MSNKQKHSLPEPFLWLQDAPLFIDREQVDRFYDAVVRPLHQEGSTTFEVTEENFEATKKALELEVGLTTQRLAAVIPIFALVKPKLKAEAGQEISSQQTKGQTRSVELLPISTPQRQLELLTLHYYVTYRNRYYFVRHRGTQKDWRDPVSISQTPRSLIFLDLPNQEEAKNGKIPETRIFPMAAEFANGKVVLLYKLLHAKNGERPPDYIERTSADQDLTEERMKYWSWFHHNIKAIQATTVIEEAASQNGRIRWIDYRVALTQDGESLHLHLSTASEFDTGVFAYNFVKRGYAHGLRLVGTLKSGPDMNVLAVYEK